MIKFEYIEVTGWEHAIRGARNAMNSWHKSDSVFIDYNGCRHTINGYDKEKNKEIFNKVDLFKGFGQPVFIGTNDLNLMQNLCKAGTDHRKFMRMITVYIDITAPLYWWKEFDTYKVGTVANSCSTMHKIHDKKFTLEDFSYEHLSMLSTDTLAQSVIPILNFHRALFIEKKDKKYWWQMIQLLPSSYNQKRTIMLNYEVLRNMYHARKNHKLDEWHDFCDWIKTLPYAEELIIGENDENSNSK